MDRPSNVLPPAGPRNAARAQRDRNRHDRVAVGAPATSTTLLAACGRKV
jgi:hypothetical protein